MESKTNVFKNFTDAVAFIAAIFAIIAVLLIKKGFEPTEEITSYLMLENVKGYIALAAVFIVSGIVNVLTRRIPTVSLAIATLPICISWRGFTEGVIDKKPIFYILLAIIHATGALVYTLQTLEDGDKNPTHEAMKAMICSFSLAFISLDLWVGSKLLTVKVEQIVKLPFRYLSVCGILCGVLGIVWYFKARKKGNDRSALFWTSLSASLVCALILIARQTVAEFGV